jgi:hypothetical protein
MKKVLWKIFAPRFKPHTIMSTDEQDTNKATLPPSFAILIKILIVRITIISLYKNFHSAEQAHLKNQPLQQP